MKNNYEYQIIFNNNSLVGLTLYLNYLNKYVRKYGPTNCPPKTALSINSFRNEIVTFLKRQALIASRFPMAAISERFDFNQKSLFHYHHYCLILRASGTRGRLGS
jgi:hypothetical protein